MNLVATSLLTVTIFFAGCDTSEPQSTAPGTETPSPTRSSPSVGCEEQVTPVDRAWRRKSTVVGPFGLYGSGRDFRGIKREGPRLDYVVKIPVVIEGQQTVTLSVPAPEIKRVSLTYRRAIFGADKVSEGDRSITFVPCDESKVTAWAGGLILHDREEITLHVTIEGRETRTVSVGS